MSQTWPCMCLLEKGLGLPSGRQEQKLYSLSFPPVLLNRSAAVEASQAKVVVVRTGCPAAGHPTQHSRKLRLQGARLEPELSRGGATNSLCWRRPWSLRVASFHEALFLEPPFSPFQDRNGVKEDVAELS